MDIDGHLWAKVDMKIKVPVKIEGSFTMNYTDDLVSQMNETTIRVCSVFELTIG